MDTWSRQKQRLQDARSVLATRSKLLDEIRKFFLSRNFIEVVTPVRICFPAIEDHIDAEPSGSHYLRTSPELHLKRILAAGYHSIFEMGPCFRKGERGRLHNPEYCMLEWYRSDTDYTNSLVDTKDLLCSVTDAILGEQALTCSEHRIELSGAWHCITVAEAFRRYAGWDPVAAFDPERFSLDLATKVEPALPRNLPVVLSDYPAEMASLARLKPEDPAVAERWELYIGGMEIANAFSELTDPSEQRLRFENCADARAAEDREIYPMDEEFLSALADMAPASGVALGVDRLLMLLTSAATLDDVMPLR